jgi:hypothetical protein
MLIIENKRIDTSNEDGNLSIKMKVCSKCNKVKEETYENFSPSSYNKFKFIAFCRQCKRERDSNYSKNNPEKSRIRQKKYQDKLRQNKPKKFRDISIDGKNVRLKICSICAIEKEENDDNFLRYSYDKSKFDARCRECNRKYCMERYWIDPEQSRKERLKSAEKILSNVETKKIFRQRVNDAEKKRVMIDPSYRLRRILSRTVNAAIKKRGKIKNGSVLLFLPYTIDQLKQHLEILFEPWMNWGNRGKYNPKTWNDNDQATWTWQLDHIIPHSTFQYTTMGCQEFRDCWALSNLRPLSAKQNLLDGVKRVRHKKKDR